MAVNDSRASGTGTRGANVHAIDTAKLHAHLLAEGQQMNEACQPGPGPPGCRASSPPAYRLAGAGDREADGVYACDPALRRDGGVAAYTKKTGGERARRRRGIAHSAGVQYSIYRLGGQWRVAEQRQGEWALLYVAAQTGHSTPPVGAGQWLGKGDAGCAKCTGAKPAPMLVDQEGGA